MSHNVLFKIIRRHNSEKHIYEKKNNNYTKLPYFDPVHFIHVIISQTVAVDNCNNWRYLFRIWNKVLFAFLIAFFEFIYLFWKTHNNFNAIIGTRAQYFRFYSLQHVREYLFYVYFSMMSFKTCTEYTNRKRKKDDNKFLWEFIRGMIVPFLLCSYIGCDPPLA